MKAQPSRSRRRRAAAAENPAQMTFFPSWEITTVGPGLFKVEQGKPSAEMRPKAVARALGVSTRTIYDWLSDGTIWDEEYRRPGGREGREGKSIWISASVIPRLRDSKKI
jgi:hypothetical protein